MKPEDHLAGDKPESTPVIDAAPSSEQPEIAWSLDGSEYAYQEMGEALDALDNNGELKVGAVIHFGEVYRYDPAKWCDADDVIEMLSDRAYEQGHEWAEDYPTPPKEAIAELDAFLSAWIRKHCEPNFYGIKNAKEYIVTEQDVADCSNEENSERTTVPSATAK